MHVVDTILESLGSLRPAPASEELHKGWRWSERFPGQREIDDRQNGHGGFWATQIPPFADPVSFTGYMELEKAWYDAQEAARAA